MDSQFWRFEQFFAAPVTDLVLDSQFWRFEQFLLANGLPSRRGKGNGNSEAFLKRRKVTEDEAAADTSQIDRQVVTMYPQTAAELFARFSGNGPPSRSILLELQQLLAPLSGVPAEDEWYQQFVKSLPDTARPEVQQEGEEGSRSGIVPEEWTSLPEELVEKIVSLLPFPNVLCARMLNKSWASKFTVYTKVFQDHMKTVSGDWQHYCPVILNLQKECLVGYDRRGDRWQKVDVAFAEDLFNQWCFLQHLKGAGALLCGVVQCDVFVINIVLRKCIWLPPRPYMNSPHEVHFLPIGSDAYRVLLISKAKKFPVEVCFQVYDSQTKSWSVSKSTIESRTLSMNSAYMDGVIYSIINDSQNFTELKLFSYNLETGTWVTILHPFRQIEHRVEISELMICQSQIMIVFHLRSKCRRGDPTRTTIRRTLSVYKLDPVTLEITLVSSGPPKTLFEPSTLSVCDNECIFFGNPHVEQSSMMELDCRAEKCRVLPQSPPQKRRAQKWRVLPQSPPYVHDRYCNKWLTLSFEPGLNPFVQL